MCTFWPNLLVYLSFTILVTGFSLLFSGKSSSLCCPLCQALLSNHNALRYHMNYVHAMQAPSGGTKLHWFLLGRRGGQQLRLKQQHQIIEPVKSDPLANQNVLFSESARCHFCAVLCADRASLKTHLEEAHQPPRHALCENCENFFHICAITRHRAKCVERYQQHAENTNTA